MDYTIWRNQWDNLVNKWSSQGYQSLNIDGRIWFNIRSLIASVDNGGIISFYYNSGADYLYETIDDLEKLKANKIIDILKKTNRLFPKGEPSGDIDERNEVISSCEDGKNDELEKLDNLFYKLEEDLELKLEPVIKRILAKDSNS